MAAITYLDDELDEAPNPIFAALKIVAFVALMAVLLIGLPVAGAAGLYALFT